MPMVALQAHGLVGLHVGRLAHEMQLGLALGAAMSSLRGSMSRGVPFDAAGCDDGGGDGGGERDGGDGGGDGGGGDVGGGCTS